MAGAREIRGGSAFPTSRARAASARPRLRGSRRPSASPRPRAAAPRATTQVAPALAAPFRRCLGSSDLRLLRPCLEPAVVPSLHEAQRATPYKTMRRAFWPSPTHSAERNPTLVKLQATLAEREPKLAEVGRQVVELGQNLVEPTSGRSHPPIDRPRPQSDRVQCKLGRSRPQHDRAWYTNGHRQHKLGRRLPL